MEQKRYPRGHFIALGIAFGVPLGIPIGIILGNIALGPALGAALGIPIGIILEKTMNSNPKELNAEERKKWMRNLSILLSVGLIALISMLILYFGF